MESYVDNMVVKSTSANTRIQDLEKTFQIMKQIGMRLNP